MRLKHRFIICYFFLFHVSIALYAQSQLEIKVQTFFTELKNSPSSYHPIPSFKNHDKIQVLKQLDLYRNDSIDIVRKNTYLIANRLTFGESDSELNQQVVNFLLKGFEDKNSGTCGLVSDLLKNYTVAAFDSNAKNKIIELLHLSPPYYQEIIKIAGFVNPESCEEVILTLLSSGVIKHGQPRWAARLALARIGNKTSIEYCLNQIIKLEVNDDLVYDYLPGLVYTRQREAVDYLIELMNSNEKNCESANPESNEMILCGYRIMEYLVPIIKNIPLQLNDSGDIDTNDYHKALITCRDWFLQNPDYKIITNQY